MRENIKEKAESVRARGERERSHGAVKPDRVKTPLVVSGGRTIYIPANHSAVSLLIWRDVINIRIKGWHACQ